jgi:hypothetical protein
MRPYTKYDSGPDTDRLKAAVSIVTVIGETVHLRRVGRQFIANCPFHLEKTPSFRVYPEQPGRAGHFHCYGCGAHGDVFDWLRLARGLSFRGALEYLGGNPNASSGTTRTGYFQCHEPMHSDDCGVDHRDDGETNRRREDASRIWREAVDPHGTPAEVYLAHRGVRLPDAPVLRFHGRCPRKSDALPAMVALMTDALGGAPTGVHRTYLLPDGSGKAKVQPAKMMLGTAGVIRLVDDEEIGIGLGLAEGIESGLACIQVIGWGPVWAAASAGAIRKFPVIAATTLNIFCDHDAAGLSAARDCAARWVAAGAEVLIHMPPTSEDWNDAVKRIAV